jgi:hypothetical protein
MVYKFPNSLFIKPLYPTSILKALKNNIFQMKLLSLLCVLCLLFDLIPFTEGGGSNDGSKKFGGTLKRFKAASAETFSKFSNVFKSNSAAAHTGLRVLMVAPNQYKSHYALNKKLALLLLEQTDWVEEVVSFFYNLNAYFI